MEDFGGAVAAGSQTSLRRKAAGMPEDVGVDGRDEPSRRAGDHAELRSELDSHDLAVARGADRSVVSAYRVPEGVVNLEDVTDEYR